MRRHRTDRGAVTVEFALIAVPAFLMLGGILILGLHAVWAGLAQHAARETLRSVTLHGKSCVSEGDLTSLADSSVGGVLNPTKIDCGPASPRAGKLVTVTITAKVPGVDELSGMVGGTLDGITFVTATASGRHE